MYIYIYIEDGEEHSLGNVFADPRAGRSLKFGKGKRPLAYILRDPFGFLYDDGF